MAIANTTPRQIAPTHPGAMLREDFMPDYGLTASTLATALGVSRQTIHELLRQEPRGHAADGVALVGSLAIPPPSGFNAATGMGHLAIRTQPQQRIDPYSTAPATM